MQCVSRAGAGAGASRACAYHPETVRARLRVYREDTEPLIAYYEERALLVRIDGAGTPAAVNAAIREALQAAAATP